MKYAIENKPLPKGANKQEPTRIVIHAMAEYLDLKTGKTYAYDFLKGIGLSAHALICPDGTVIRCRKDNQGAYHAKGYNKNSLGIEFLVEGTYDYGSFKETISDFYLTHEQHITGVELIREWCNNHNIESINRHSTLSPGRKVDPGSGFPWDLFMEDVNNGIEGNINNE